MYTHEQIDGYHALRLHQIVRGTNPGVTTVYAFANMVTQPSEYGIAMYNPSGEMIYHGEMMLLDAKLIPVDIKFEKDLGYPCAIMPALVVKWHTEFGHLNRGDMLTSEQHRCSNEKKKFQRRV